MKRWFIYLSCKYVYFCILVLLGRCIAFVRKLTLLYFFGQRNKRDLRDNSKNFGTEKIKIFVPQISNTDSYSIGCLLVSSDRTYARNIRSKALNHFRRFSRYPAMRLNYSTYTHANRIESTVLLLVYFED